MGFNGMVKEIELLILCMHLSIFDSRSHVQEQSLWGTPDKFSFKHLDYGTLFHMFYFKRLP